MSEIFSEIKNIRKYIRKIIKLPIRCWMLILGTLFSFQPKLVELLDMKKWFPDNIYHIISFLIKLIFDNIVWIGLVLFIFGVLFLSLNKLPEGIKKQLFPENRLIDGENIKVYSPIFAPGIIYDIFIEIITTLWSCYFIFLTLFDRSTLFLLFSTQNDQIIQSVLWKICLVVNIGYLFKEVSKSLFTVSLPRLSDYISYDDWGIYRIITSFEYKGKVQNHLTNENIRILLLKSRDVKTNIYYVAELQLTNQYMKKKYNSNSSKIPIGKLEYRLINSSENFEEIKFHYESIKLEKSEFIVDSSEKVDRPELRSNN